MHVSEDIDKLRKKLLGKKEPEFDDLRNSQPIQIVKDAKIRKESQGYHRCTLFVLGIHTETIL